MMRLSLGQLLGYISGPRIRRGLFVILALAVSATLVGASLAAPGGAPPPQPAQAPFVRPAYSLSTSLIAFWKLGEASGTRADSVGTSCGGSGCSLTDNNTVTQATGIVGNAGQFTAANSESLSHADDNDLDGNSTSFTVTAWVYIDSTPSATSNRYIVGKHVGNTDYSMLLNTNGSGVERFNCLQGNASLGQPSAVATTFGSPSNSTWYFVVCRYDSSTHRIYISVNGGTEDSANTNVDAVAGTGAFRLGSISGGGSYWDGRIDAVGWWKKSLSATEIGYLYNSGAGCEYPFTACEPTPTPTVTLTPTITLTPTVTNTFTPTITNTPTATNTFTPTITGTPTASPTGTPLPTDTPTITNTPTDVPTDTPTPTDTPAPTATNTPTPTPTPEVCATGAPDYRECHTLASGDLFIVDRRISYGEIFTTIALVALTLVQILRWAYDFAMRWLN